MTISVHGPYGDPRAQARRANLTATAHAVVQGSRQMAGADPLNVPWHAGPPMQTGWYGADWQHHKSPAELQRLQQRFENFLPKMASTGGPGRAQSFFQDILPNGATLAPNAGAGYRQAMQNHYDLRRRAGPYNLPYGGTIGGSSGFGGGGGGGGGFYQQNQRPYQPEFESPDRQNYPVHRNLANIYWRLFYKLDPIVGNGVDMYAELPWGNCELVGEGVDGEIKDAYERMWEVCNVRAMLPYFVREYLVVGEACPYLFWDDTDKMWTHLGMHNPDQLEVIYTPFIKMDPIVRFKPDHRLQQVLSSSSQMISAVRDSMPPELLAALMSGQNIELSPINFTFLPRKMHPYDVRGTSILSRMWRAFMYEDAIFNASIATARRHAGPIKVAKLGDRTTGWIPDPSHEQKLLELLAQAEMDPHAWIIYHYGIEFDLVGTTERVMTIDKHWDLIERIKLIALGISKAFLHGEVTYASAASGLTVFLQRLKALREYFEQSWIIPKFFRQAAEMNAWVKPTPAEVSGQGPYVRTRRSNWQLRDDNRYIVPSLEWDRQLDPTVESAQITAVQALTQMGVHFSKQYLASLVGRDWEEELEQRANEAAIEKKIFEKHPGLQISLMQSQQPADGGGPPPMPGMPSGVLPGLDFGDGGGEPAPPGGAPGGEAPAAGMEADKGSSGAPGGIWQNGRFGNWEKDTVQSLIELFQGEAPDDELWLRMVEESQRVAEMLPTHDAEAIWDAVEEWLMDAGYPSSDIVTLEDILKLERVLGGEPRTRQAFQLAREYEKLAKNEEDDLLVGAL